MTASTPIDPRDAQGERILFTPGPLTTTSTVKAAMLRDIGSWDADCVRVCADIRQRLVQLAPTEEELTCTLMQGSGSFGVESMIGSAVPADGKLLVLENGAYGERVRRTAEVLGIDVVVADDPEDTPHDPARVDAALASDPSITHVVCVHCETTTGVLNPLREIGLVVQRRGARLLVDAISTFAAYPIGAGEAIDFAAGPIDHLVGSANKCNEGVPGFSFVLSRVGAMELCRNTARSHCLDLFDQWDGFEKTGRFRFTPPTHVLLAFQRALDELEAEGGVVARARRYKENCRVLVEGMVELGFAPLVEMPHRSYIITAFRFPVPDFDFDGFYAALHSRGYIIYPGKLTHTPTFRIGNIGSIGIDEIHGLLKAVAEVT